VWSSVVGCLRCGRLNARGVLVFGGEGDGEMRAVERCRGCRIRRTALVRCSRSLLVGARQRPPTPPCWPAPTTAHRLLARANDRLPRNERAGSVPSRARPPSCRTRCPAAEDRWVISREQTRVNSHERRRRKIDLRSDHAVGAMQPACYATRSEIPLDDGQRVNPLTAITWTRSPVCCVRTSKMNR
jgi:hypothetical protein